MSKQSCHTASTTTSVVESAFLPTITEEELYSLLGSFGWHQSPGIDKIRMFDLFRNFGVLKHILLEILNEIITSGSIPTLLKTAVVRPLLKGGDAGCVHNYRPISILPSLAKVLEKHIFLVMNSFICKSGGFSECQYGFIEKRGTQALLEEISDHLFSSLERNLVSCALFLDVAKAFDTVCHAILLDKLYNSGFRGPFFRLLDNFLTDRSQLVSISNIYSSRVFLRAGVPQGSILSALLFNVYVKDMSNVLSTCKLFQYADDTAIVATHVNFSNAFSMLQNDVEKLMDWFDINVITINHSKSRLVCFHSPLKSVSLSYSLYLHTSRCVNCSCPPINFSDSVKYLGIWFDSGLLFSIHLHMQQTP